MIQVTAAILLHEDKILIAQRPSNDKLAYKWEFPGGKIDKGESPEECLRRELREELDIDVTIGEFFGDSIYHYGYKTIHLIAYWVKWNGRKLKAKVHSDLKWVTIEQLRDYDFAPADIPLVKKLINFR